MAINNNYNTDSIESLGIIGGVREKPSSIGLENHNHTFVEILANAIDEHREGFGNEIIVIKHEDNSISVQDFGRSVPMDKNSKGEYAYNKVFNELWAGGKYNNNDNPDEANYQYSLGTNGCGATGTNYTSDFFEATAFSPNSYKYNIRYEKGIQKSDFNKTIKLEDFTGTIIHWKPSAEVFRGRDNIDDNFIIDTIRQQSIVNAGLKIDYNNIPKQNKVEFYYEHGIIDYIKSIDKEKSFTDIIKWTTEVKLIEKDTTSSDMTKHDKKEKIEIPFKFKANIFFTFNNEINLLNYYHNSSWLKNGGTPERYIKNSFTYAIDKYIKSMNLYNKSEKKITFDDIKDSLIIISDTYSTISLYTDQVKKEMQSDAVQEYMTQYLKDQLAILFIENPMEADKIINQVLINKRAREKANRIRTEEKKKAKTQIRKPVGKLTDCTSHNFEEKEIYLTEGDSAGGNAKQGRNRIYQAILPQRGKSKNVEKNNKDVLQSQDLKNIKDSLGVGHDKDYKEKDLRYNKVILMADGDSDGAGHIVPLWLTYFYRYMPQLILNGHVYIAVPPLYKNTLKTKKVSYTYSETEQNEFLKTLSEKPSIQRFKGLGEMNPDQLWETTMNPETRKLIQVTIEDAEYCEETFQLLMGKEVAPRREFIMQNAKFAKLD